MRDGAVKEGGGLRRVGTVGNVTRGARKAQLLIIPFCMTTVAGDHKYFSQRGYYIYTIPHSP